jgi:hypothetical protein
MSSAGMATNGPLVILNMALAGSRISTTGSAASVKADSVYL